MYVHAYYFYYLVFTGSLVRKLILNTDMFVSIKCTFIKIVEMVVFFGCDS